MLEVNRLYPQYNVVKDRRQQKNPISPIAFERRSGIDRRNDDRIKLDTTLTRDIFEVKNKVSQVQNVALKTAQDTHSANNAQSPTFTQSVSKAAQNSIKTDEFVRTTKPNAFETPKEIEKSKAETGSIAGILGAVLGGTLASTFLGVAGIGIAVGIGAYFGGRFLKGIIVSHIKNK